MTYLEIWNLRQSSGELKARAAVAVSAAANGILGENADVTNHAARMIWALNALRDIPAEAERMMWALMGNTTILQLGSSVDDASLQYIVSNLLVPAFVGA